MNMAADSARQAINFHLDDAIRENDAHIIGLIQNAISRIDRGDYMYCTNCGGKIGEDRLEALPYADTCLDCADAEHGELGGLGKPTTFPGRHGDPTWPKFNQYGTSDSIQDQPRQVRDDIRPD